MFSPAWTEYAEALAKYPSYSRNTVWPKIATESINALGAKPTAAELYRAAASYIVATEVDWSFEYPPIGTGLNNVPARRAQSRLWGKLRQAWRTFDSDPKSREFCRVGFIVCSPAVVWPLDADDIVRDLLEAYPNDRLLIGALVQYSVQPDEPNTDRWRSWVLDTAKRLPGLKGGRPHDYLALGVAYVAHHWVKDTLDDAIGYRDCLLSYQRSAPKELADRVKPLLEGVNEHIKRLGGA